MIYNVNYKVDAQFGAKKNLLKIKICISSESYEVQETEVLLNICQLLP